MVKPRVANYKKYLNEEYNGKIDNIEYREGDRGVPHIYINGKWIPFEESLSLMTKIQIGDSVSKVKGSSEAWVFRLDSGKSYCRRK